MPTPRDAEFLQRYNAAEDLLQRNLVSRADKTALIDHHGGHSYAALAERASRFANLLADSGIQPEQRVLLALEDGADFVACFLGALHAGVVAVPLNTLLTPDDYAFILADSRASAIVASPALVARLPECGLPRFCAGPGTDGYLALDDALAGQASAAPVADTRADDVAFWLYTSGTTGRPKGVMHAHSDLLATATLYADNVLKLTAEDVVFSAAKLFFAYGLGNALTFPFAAGATAVLHAGQPTPEAVQSLINEHRPTVFFGVPTLYAMMLNGNCLPGPGHRLRICVSAGEALPEAILNRWQRDTGVDILDGIGSTEMLHIYMSNRAGDIIPGSSGTPVPGYEVKLMNEDGAPAAAGDLGDLYVSGPSMTLGYWNRRALNRDTFHGRWMRTGDKYRISDSGAYVYCGRSDDLLKVGGIYVSPMEVENVLLQHEAVAEVAVVGAEDADELVKPKAFVVAAGGVQVSPALADALITHVQDTLAPYKRPRWVEFVESLPKTATGKIQRYKLRG